MTTPTDPVNNPSPSGADLIAAERLRQIETEGWTPEHDDEHDDGSLTIAAVEYVQFAQHQIHEFVNFPEGDLGSQWPWEPSSWKPSDDPIRNLVKAGALIAAEIDRLQRVSPSCTEPTEENNG